MIYCEKMKLSSSESLMGAAMRLFPEIGLEETKFPQVRRRYTQSDKTHPTNIQQEDIGMTLRTTATFLSSLRKGTILIHL